MPIEKYVHLININFPQLQWESLQFIQTWWTNDIIILDDNIVFRFPKTESAKKNLCNEILLLKSINEFISLKIPNYSLISSDKTFAWYSIIEWTELDLDKLNTNTDSIAKDLGFFLSQLHSIPINNILGVEKNVSCHYTFNKWYITYILNKYLEIETQIDKELFKECMDFIQKSFSNPIPEKFSLTHFDLQWKNIIFSNNTNSISGIIDFSESVVYDPAIDFSKLYTYWEDFVQKVLKNYQIDDNEILVRAYFFEKKDFIFSLPFQIEKFPHTRFNLLNKLQDFIRR